MAHDFDVAGYIQEVTLPGLELAYFVKPYQDLVSNFSEDSMNPGGPKIIHQIQTAYNSNARNFTKSDVDPVAGDIEGVNAEWDLTYQETAAEVFQIDVNQALGSGMNAVDNLLNKAVQDALGGLWELIYDNVYAQIKLDLTTAGTYSDAALNRTTYPGLALYNELTDSTITVANMRDCQFTTTFNKNGGVDYSMYRFVMEPTVYHKLKPQVALLSTWSQDNNNTPVNGGYAPIANFEGTPISTPQGMTVGDVFFVRPGDVHVKKHLPLQSVNVPAGRFTTKVIIRTGINAWVENVGKQGMMTNKD